MSIKYDSRRLALAEIIKEASHNATYVIPDLQRPYVWDPSQVTLLIDSLFKGWPFGSLLLWEVKPDCFTENEGIPHRPFWQVVDRTARDGGSRAMPMGQPATYHMVLDGQQRVQSLILALGADQCGFTLHDHEWALDQQERRVKPSDYSSNARLCLDTVAFESELKEKGKVRRLEMAKILRWVTPEAGARPATYGFPLPAIKGNGDIPGNPGRFIRLSRFWTLAQNGLEPAEYAELLGPILSDHGIARAEELCQPLSQFMQVVAGVKNNSFVHALQIESFRLTPQWTKEDYGDAIVTIFTRLNTAGRTLTREEITLAWLKVGWDPKLTENKTAGECLEHLKLTLQSRGFKVEMDEIVRLISFLWAVDANDGNLLDSKDLLKGAVIRPMANAIATSWNALTPRLNRAAEIIEQKDLVDRLGSFNAVIVFLTWYRLAFDWADRQRTLSVPERDSLEKRLHALAQNFLDRFLFSSQWGGTWGEGAASNFAAFAKELLQMKQTLALSKAWSSEVPAGMTVCIDAIMGRVAPKAIEAINALAVRSRHQVHKYHDALWVWHRLDGSRMNYSLAPMKTGRKRTTKEEVDHTIADAWWKRLVETLTTERREAFEGSDEERVTLGPEGFDTHLAAVEFINQLGNCSLLNKSFNISKSDQTMWAFLQEVHEFRESKWTRSALEAALSLPSSLTDPTGVALAELVESIRSRDASIKRELVEFISGQRERVAETS